MSPYNTPPSKRSVTTREDCQEVDRSALVKGIESKVAALIWGVCGGTALSSALHGHVCEPPIDCDSHDNP
jgi:hypothetical protein